MNGVSLNQLREGFNIAAMLLLLLLLLPLLIPVSNVPPCCVCSAPLCSALCCCTGTWRRYCIAQSLSGAVYTTIPLLVGIFTFIAYIGTGHTLDVATALTSLALFEILRFPLFMLPNVLNNVVEARVSGKYYFKLTYLLLLSALESPNRFSFLYLH